MNGAPESGESNGGQQRESDRNEDESNGEIHGDRQSESRQETSTGQTVLILISVGVTLLLFGYAGWQMVVPPQTDAPPQASVVGTEPMANGSVAVTVRLRNPRDVGLVTATVQSNCSSPPATVQFSFLPASSTRTGTVVCPPGTTNPSVSMANWVSR